MKWVGLTGGIAAGKSTVAKILEDFGFHVIDADKLAKQAVGPGTEGLSKVVQEFGPGVLSAHGELDRKKLGEVVFADEKKRRKLEAIIHPIVQMEVVNLKSHFEKAGEPVVFYDVPLLYENNLEKNFDHVLVIGSPETVQIQRIQSRNMLNYDQALSRVRAQLPIEIKKAKADFYIENSGNLPELKNKVLEYLQKIQISPKK